MKIIRPTYPKEISIGLLLLIFVVAFFLSSQIFATHVHELDLWVYFGMFVISCAVIIMALVLWEEFLFPIHVKPLDGGVNFRNHRNKLRKQLLIYLTIPIAFAFVYLNYEINTVRFFIWAGICVVLPLVGKLFSGIKNYNDFLTLTTNYIEYKNNEKVGKFAVADIQSIQLVKDDRKVLHKFQITLKNNIQVMIDMDEMELEAFFNEIDAYIETNYKSLVR